jgi:Protein of unknown function (DUF2924)
MQLNMSHEMAVLRRLSNRELYSKFAELYGNDARTSKNRVWLIRRIAWRMQALAEGDLSDRARQRATELANDADLRLTPPRMKPAAPPPKPRTRRTSVPRPSSPNRLRTGTVLARMYKGEAIHVTVLNHGFAFDGRVYSSLSAVAKAITGSHCSGYRFFGLTSQGGEQ